MYANAAAIRRDIAGLIRPPRRIRVSEAAAKYVKVVTAGGSIPWDPDISPYMVEPMDLFGSRRYEAVVFVGPSRTGKTEALLDCTISYAVLCDPGDFLVYFASESNAESYSKLRLRRLHAHSEQIHASLSPRQHDNNIRTTIYRHGMNLTLAWPTSGQVAQRDARYVLGTDFDSMPDDIDGEGSPYVVIKKRVQAMMSAGRCLIESSPKRSITDASWSQKFPHEAPPVAGGILPIYNLGDRRMLYWRCLHCREWFRVPALPSYTDRGDMDATADSAYVPCTICGAIHTQDQRRALNIASRWVPDRCTISGDGNIDGTPIPSSIASFWLLGCAAAFQLWRSLVFDHLSGEQVYRETGEENLLRGYVNTGQGLPYLPRSMRGSRNSMQLQARAEDWTVRTVPAGVCFLVASIDVQGYRFVIQVVGWGYKDERWFIDRYQITESPGRRDQDGKALRLDPASYPEDWIAIRDQIIDRRYPLASNEQTALKPVIAVCDSGGKAGVTERAYGFWRTLRAGGLHRRFALVKGNANAKSGQPLVQESWPDSPRKDRKAKARGDVPVYLLNTLDIKDALDADLKRAEPGPGYLHIPSWIDDAVFSELSAETRGPKGWTKGRGANEAWDLLTYDRAAPKILELWQHRPLDWDRPPPWAQTGPNNPFLTSAVDVQTKSGGIIGSLDQFSRFRH